MKHHFSQQTRSLDIPLLRKQYQHCSRESPPGRLKRIQALDAVLPRPSSPHSPVYYSSDKEMRRVLEDTEDALSACEVSCYFVNGGRGQKGKAGSPKLREVSRSLLVQMSIMRKEEGKPRFRRYNSRKEKPAKRLASSNRVLPPIGKGYRLFRKHRLSPSLLF
jgi:hypothetical protein